MKKTVLLVLALVFALGAGLVYMGHRGQEAYAASGFSSEGAFKAIGALSGDVSDAWEKQLKPGLDALPEAERGALTDVARAVLSAAWEAQSPGA